MTRGVLLFALWVAVTVAVFLGGCGRAVAPADAGPTDAGDLCGGCRGYIVPDNDVQSPQRQACRNDALLRRLRCFLDIGP